MKQSEIRALPNGLIACPKNKAIILMPELADIINSAPIPHQDYIVDIKVHMLMPNMWPCIPNWHCDMVPRDANGKLQPDKINLNEKMFLWLSNPPLTEFKDGRVVKPNEWIEFTQNDLHRGFASTEHIWRVFIRMTPKTIYPLVNANSYMRRHTQVYLDADDFFW